MICGGGGAKSMKTPHFLASRAYIQNCLDESSNLAHRGMYAKFQLVWSGPWGGLEIDFTSYNWRISVHDALPALFGFI